LSGGAAEPFETIVADANDADLAFDLWGGFGGTNAGQENRGRNGGNQNQSLAHGHFLGGERELRTACGAKAGRAGEDSGLSDGVKRK
jgi:hypothetical protein